MSITIELPDDLTPALQTLTEKFGSTEQVITRLVREEAQRVTMDTNLISFDEWKTQFDEMIALAQPRGTNVDYDRAGFYPETVQ